MALKIRKGITIHRERKSGGFEIEFTFTHPRWPQPSTSTGPVFIPDDLRIRPVLTDLFNQLNEKVKVEFKWDLNKIFM